MGDDLHNQVFLVAKAVRRAQNEAQGLFSPSTHPRETVFSGLQLKDDAIPMTFDHGRELLEWLKPLPAYIV